MVAGHLAGHAWRIVLAPVRFANYLVTGWRTLPLRFAQQRTLLVPGPVRLSSDSVPIRLTFSRRGQHTLYGFGPQTRSALHTVVWTLQLLHLGSLRTSLIVVPVRWFNLLRLNTGLYLRPCTTLPAVGSSGFGFVDPAVYHMTTPRTANMG